MSDNFTMIDTADCTRLNWKAADRGETVGRRGEEHPHLADRAATAEYAPEVAGQMAAGKWKQLDDVFWTMIPFGTGGRRGKMYPIGTNAINDRTIGESAQGLADYVQGEHAARQAAGLRDRLRHAASLAAIRRVVRRDHGRRRLQGLFSRRLPQHAGTFLHRALQAVRLRHHHHGQPQSAQPTTR